jgi:hypothetical protein
MKGTNEMSQGKYQTLKFPEKVRKRMKLLYVLSAKSRKAAKPF